MRPRLVNGMRRSLTEVGSGTVSAREDAKASGASTWKGEQDGKRTAAARQNSGNTLNRHDFSTNGESISPKAARVDDNAQVFR